MSHLYDSLDNSKALNKEKSTKSDAQNFSAVGHLNRNMASIKPIVTHSKDFAPRRRGRNSLKASDDVQSGEWPNSNEIEEYLAAGVDDIEER